LIRRLTRYLMLSPRELGILLLLFACSLPAVTARLYSSDEVEYFSYLRSLWFDHDVSFENEYQYFYDHRIAQSGDFHQTFLELTTPAGRRINYGTLGSAILWAPFYAVGDAVARVAHASGREVSIDGYSRPYVSAVAYGSAFYGFAAIVLGIAAARRLVGAGEIGSGLAVWLGTPVLFYMYIAPPFSHACSAFAVALLVSTWLHVRTAWSVRGAALLGLTGALVAMVREQDILFAVVPALDYALTVAARPPEGGLGTRVGRSLVPALAGCAAFAIGYLPQVLAYQALNGRPRPSELVTRKMNWAAPHALQVLASPEHGFFFWTPLAVLSIAGLAMLALRGDADRRRIGGGLLLMVALQVYVSGAVESWTVAGAFGQRRFVSITMLLVVGLAVIRQRAAAWKPARIAVNATIALAVWWNVALMAEFGTQLMDRHRLELRRNAYDAFITLPAMAPELAYRYLAHRSSFYKPQPAPQQDRP
jgi:hypothetical protein